MTYYHCYYLSLLYIIIYLFDYFFSLFYFILFYFNFNLILIFILLSLQNRANYYPNARSHHQNGRSQVPCHAYNKAEKKRKRKEKKRKEKGQSNLSKYISHIVPSTVVSYIYQCHMYTYHTSSYSVYVWRVYRVHRGRKKIMARVRLMMMIDHCPVQLYFGPIYNNIIR